MAILPLVLSPDPLLKEISKPVKKVTPTIQKLMDDMLETMYDRNGIGLAAVQVGVLKRILVMDFNHGSDRYPDEGGDGESNPIFMVNPEVIAHSEEENIYEEGCLSFPGQYAKVTRPRTATVKYLAYDGHEQVMECDEITATCVQHEIDHLNGITFIDHISRMKRDMIIKKMFKHHEFTPAEINKDYED
jgi:peptide deformylase